MTTTLSYKPGTIVRFKGTDGKQVHMGFVWDKIQVMELIAGEEFGRFICRVYLTDVNQPHPLRLSQPPSDRLPTWFKSLSSNGWSLQKSIQQVVNAVREFDGSEYHQVYNNCQHFAYLASQGYKESPDADAFKLVGWLAGSGGPSASLTSASVSSEVCQKCRASAISAIKRWMDPGNMLF